ncbi:hypothetical protein SAMN05444287_1972 [Octadecabacter temperatus]|uniref:Uncharacterized protein n=1 Tax=Octadecabacter temperatus TaxID=1458307 RepID=A0A0K0Y7A4_9RHOB|nr:hypothetical protein [Octadecabacter temperatus]AKS46848.1 hypothetical protein OSB_23120 [Octadecabacter temperatus]SIO22429.1 hypothetical protein SAMN05444287_1972 [Octadecabacter temperatus]
MERILQGLEVLRESDDISDLNAFQVYFRLYGGWPALLTSWYFWLSLFFSFLCYPIWNEEVENERIWTSSAVEIIPSLMSFSLGGMAILLAFSNEKLMERIQESGAADSLYMKTSASFFHFILLQTLSLLAVLLTQAFSVDLLSWFGFFLMSYGLMVAVAVSGNLLKLAQVFNLLAAKKK